jgi:O-antigen/teichoic acid export membrane protein
MINILKINHERSKNIIKNIIISFALKGISIGISLLLVPMTLNYLDKERYGLWLTISSIISWFSLFDIGLCNGFRNKFAEAIALGNTALARIYASTTFFLLSIIIGFVLIVFLLVNPLLDWGIILNTTAESSKYLSLLVVTVFCFFSVQFVFKLTTTLLLAVQKSALADLIGVVGSLLALLIIYILLNISKRSLFVLCLTLSGSPLLVLVIATIVLFGGKYSAYRPSFKFIDFKQSRNLVGVGFLFFIPQISSLIILSTSNLIIAQVFTPSEVTVYNIAYKYFSLITMFFQTITTPFWSAFTDAFIKNDFLWIKKAIHRLILLWVLSFLVVIIMVVFSDFVFNLWIGNQIKIPIQLSSGLALFVCINNWNAIFVSFNMGVSKIALSVWLALASSVVFIPLALILSKNFGLSGIALATGLSIFHTNIISVIQYRKLTNQTAKGIWIK